MPEPPERMTGVSVCIATRLSATGGAYHMGRSRSLQVKPGTRGITQTKAKNVRRGIYGILSLVQPKAAMRTPERKRILVTGGAGFIGSHLMRPPAGDRGHEVLCVDNLFHRHPDNIAHLLDHRDFEFMRHDVTFPLFVEVDEIYNLACPASPIHYQHDPVQTTKTSVHGAINMLGLAKRLARAHPAGVDQRSLWRPGSPPAGRSLLGPCEPDWAASLL